MTPRVVLDSNVIVSGLAWAGPPSRIVDAALDGQLEMMTSHSLLRELRRVFAYPKLAKVIGEGERLAVSGEAHLLELGSFRGIPIVEPSQFVSDVLER